MSGKPKKGVRISEGPPAVKEIPHRSEVLEFVPIIDPMTGQLIYVPLTEEYRRKHETTTAQEFRDAALEAREEGKKTSGERGHRLTGEERKKNKEKEDNPVTRRGEGAKTKRRRNKKRRTIRK